MKRAAPKSKPKNDKRQKMEDGEKKPITSKRQIKKDDKDKDFKLAEFMANALTVNVTDFSRN